MPGVLFHDEDEGNGAEGAELAIDARLHDHAGVEHDGEPDGQDEEVVGEALRLE